MQWCDLILQRTPAICHGSTCTGECLVMGRVKLVANTVIIEINKMHAHFPHCNNKPHIDNLFCESVLVGAPRSRKKIHPKESPYLGTICNVYIYIMLLGRYFHVNSYIQCSSNKKHNFLAFTWSQLLNCMRNARAIMSNEIKIRVLWQTVSILKYFN